MKLATLKTEHRDGALIVVNRQLNQYVTAENVASTLQSAMENWSDAAPQLKQIYNELNNEERPGQPLSTARLAAPLPRAYQWLDGSAYLTHVERVRKARGAVMPDSFLTDPLMYQGGSDYFLSATDPICVKNLEWGIDLEAEIAIITDDVPINVLPEDAGKHIKLIMLVNDISLRNLIPAELAKGFGFLHAKPPTAFSLVAITPDELGDAWQDDKVHLPLVTHLNENPFGHPNAGEDMQFNFAELISHAAKTRPLSAGTIIGSGTVSNADLSRGCSCLAEKRVLEIIESGKAQTPFLQFGDKVRIEMFNAKGESLFGAIDQVVNPCPN